MSEDNWERRQIEQMDTVGFCYRARNVKDMFDKILEEMEELYITYAKYLEVKGWDEDKCKRLANKILTTLNQIRHEISLLNALMCLKYGRR